MNKGFLIVIEGIDGSGKSTQVELLTKYLTDKNIPYEVISFPRYEFNNGYIKDFEKAGLVISARSVVKNLVEIIELPKDFHPFYMGTQGHPEYKSRPLSPHPIFLEFIKAVSYKD